MASFAPLIGVGLPPASAPDSQNVLAALLGDSKQGREVLVEQANGLALRKGPWKYIEGRKGMAVLKNTNTETGNALLPQLYDLSKDPAEKDNVAAGQPALVTELAAQLQAIRRAGGDADVNDTR